MTAVKAGDVERILKNLPASATLLLVYGPDAGLVSERAGRAARGAVSDPGDSFQLIRVAGDTLADEPSRLVEEASTFGMFGGTRAIWVKPTARNIAPAVIACLDVALTDTLVVVEAGDLQKASPLRVACEASSRAMALPCYADEGRDIGGLIRDTLAEAGLRIAADASQLLADSLGGDRLASRSELTKLATYAHGRSEITTEDVEAVVSDVSGLNLDELVDAAFAGDRTALEAAWVGPAGQGSAPAALSATLRHGLQLLEVRARMDAGHDVDSAMRSWRGLQFRRRDSVMRQVRRWQLGPLVTSTAEIQQAVLDSRRAPALAGVTASRTLMRIAERARSADRRTESRA